MNDITKLPKWAQTEIEVLRRRVANLQEKLDQVDGATGTMYWMNSSTVDLVKHGLPDYASVYATVEGGEIEVNVQDGSLIVRTVRGNPIVQPQATNVFKVKVGEYW